MISPILQYYQNLEKTFDQISPKRQAKLQQLSEYILSKYQSQQTPQIIVVCTHNSRRSHFGQIGLAVAATYYQLPYLATYSGGTEATAFNPRAVATLQHLGFSIDTQNSSTSNPTYAVRWTTDMEPYQAFSKRYDTSPNPTQSFAAVMVCSEADEACPIIEGCDLRLALPYDDPKAFDDTLQEAQKYLERYEQIGREMLFVLWSVKERL